MAVIKDPSLHDWLLGLNFQIFSWTLSIGDWIEYAIDWAIIQVNWVWVWIDWLWAQLELVPDKIAQSWANTAASILHWAAQLSATIYTEVGKVQAGLTALQSWVTSAWAAWSAQLNDWVAALLAPLQAAAAAWEQFKSSTLPGLLSFSWFTGWWGSTGITFDSWWQVTRSNLADDTELGIAPIREEVQRHSDWLDGIKGLVADPEAWLLARLEDMVVRFW